MPPRGLVKLDVIARPSPQSLSPPPAWFFSHFHFCASDLVDAGFLRSAGDLAYLAARAGSICMLLGSTTKLEVDLMFLDVGFAVPNI